MRPGVRVDAPTGLYDRGRRPIPRVLGGHLSKGLAATREGSFKLTFAALVVAAAVVATVHPSRQNVSTVELAVVLALGMAVSGGLLLGAQTNRAAIQAGRQRGAGGGDACVRIHRLRSPYGVVLPREQAGPGRNLRRGSVRIVCGVSGHRRAPLGRCRTLGGRAGRRIVAALAGHGGRARRAGRRAVTERTQVLDCPDRSMRRRGRCRVRGLSGRGRISLGSSRPPGRARGRRRGGHVDGPRGGEAIFRRRLGEVRGRARDRVRRNAERVFRRVRLDRPREHHAEVSRRRHDRLPFDVR